MTDHSQTSTMPPRQATPRIRRFGKRLPAPQRGLRLGAVAAPLPLLLAITASAG